MLVDQAAIECFITLGLGLGLDSAQWFTLTTELEKHFCYVAGAEQMMNAFKRHPRHQRLRGMTKAKALLKRAQDIATNTSNATLVTQAFA